MKRISRIVILIICVPLAGTMFVKPDRSGWKKEETDMGALDGRFQIRVREGVGNYLYSPEKFTQLLMYRAIPEDMEFGVSEDYIEGTDRARDPEQEYLKALSIVCRSNILYGWEREGCPRTLDYDRMHLEAAGFLDTRGQTAQEESRQIRRNEIKKAAEATMGAVITKEGRVSAAPFFTTQPSDMLVGEAGGGTGFSLNYACGLAGQGMDFYEILKYFFADIKVNIYE